MVPLRRLTGLVLAGLLAASCSAPPRPPAERPLTKVTYVTGFGLYGQEAYMVLGQELGFFRRAGLDVTIRPGAGTEANLKLLLAGQADVVIVDVTGALIAYGKGVRGFTTVAAIHQRSESCIITLDNRGISSPKDLAGKRVGYQPGGVNYTLFPVYARLAGIDASRITWVQTPPQRMRALMLSGSLDAATDLVVNKAGIEAAAPGRHAVVLPYSDYLTDLYGNALAVSTKLAHDNPDLVRRFRDATLAALEYAIDHPDETGRIFAKRQPGYPAQAAAAETALTAPYARSAGAGAPVGAIRPERVARTIALLQSAGAVPEGITPDQVVDFDLAPGRGAAR
ncbi:MAG TPA: ABC transporter substrate-binding protein [Micromonosporaceae bacterium]